MDDRAPRISVQTKLVELDRKPSTSNGTCRRNPSAALFDLQTSFPEYRGERGRKLLTLLSLRTNTAYRPSRCQASEKHHLLTW